MKFLLFGFWDIPVSSYLMFYGALGIAGFFFSYLHRYLLALAIPVIVWFAVADFQGFYRYNVGPANDYVFLVSLSMVFAVIASLAGAALNNRKVLKFN